MANPISCPFCIEGFLENAFLESSNFLAIYNIAPILPGHSMIIPKKHFESLFELSEIQLTEFFSFAREVAKFLIEVFEGEGFDWSLQENKVAGQTVEHLHLHIVIRKKGDLSSPGKWYPMIEDNENLLLDSAQRKRLDMESYKKITAFLKEKAQDFILRSL